MRLRRSIFFVAACAALALPTSAHADEPVRVLESHPDEFPEGRARGRILAAGAGVLAGFYGAAVAASFAWPDSPGAEDLRIPIAGPWIALADTGCRDDEPDCSIFPVVLRAILTTIDGIAQAGGVGILLESAFMPARASASPAQAGRAAGSRGTPALRWREVARLPDAPPGRRIRAIPFATGRDGVGIGILGRF